MFSTASKLKAILLLAGLFSADAYSTNILFAQDADFVFNYRSSVFAGTADQLPFWLHANRLGKVDLESTNFINELGAHTVLGELRDFSLRAGANAVFRLSEQESIHFTELYIRADYYTFRLDAGRFKQPVGSNNHELSAGSMMVSNNAVPVTKISLSNPEFVNVPGLSGFLQYKGLFTHGRFSGNRYVDEPYLHQKYLYLRFNIGNFSGTGGFVHNVVWGGSRGSTRLPQSFEDYLRVITGSGAPDSSDAPGIEKDNVLGNSVAAYEFAALYRFKNFSLSLTRMFYLEDKVSTRFRSPWDGVWGANVRLPGQEGVIEGITYEHINTIQQDSKKGEIVGRAHYYHNGLYKSGWTHEHRVLGTPLIVYDKELDRIVNSVLVGHHLGFKGHLTSRIAYRALATYTRNYGMREDWTQEGFDVPRSRFRKDQYSFLLDFRYEPVGGEGLGINLSIGSDMGELYKDNLGVMVGISWNGFLSY